jgi:hypothetical protein
LVERLNGIQEASGSNPLSSTNLKVFILTNYLIIFLFLILLLPLTSCKDTITSDEIDSRPIPDNNVSFSQNLYPVLNVKCANAGCHDEQTRAGGLSVMTWATFTSDASIIFPYQPDNSRLIWSIEGRAGVPPMPPLGYPHLTFPQIKGFRTWIAEGAQNN